jgi:hypothetical protein
VVDAIVALASAVAIHGVYDIVSTEERYFIRDGRQWQSLPLPFTASAALLQYSVRYLH